MRLGPFPLRRVEILEAFVAGLAAENAGLLDRVLRLETRVEALETNAVSVRGTGDPWAIGDPDADPVFGPSRTTDPEWINDPPMH